MRCAWRHGRRMSAERASPDDAQLTSDECSDGAAGWSKKEPWWPPAEVDPWCPWTWRDFSLSASHDPATRPAS